jgi:hypothetical protein
MSSTPHVLVKLLMGAKFHAGVKKTPCCVPHTIASVAFINLDEGFDPFMSRLRKDGFFTTNSMYSYIVNN